MADGEDSASIMTDLDSNLYNRDISEFADLEFQRMNEALQFIFDMMFVIATIVIIAGNTLYLLAIFRNKKLRSVINLLLVNIAVIDILNFISFSLVKIADEVHHWFLGVSLCKILVMIPEIQKFVMTYTLLVIAIERYLVIVRRNDKPWSPIAVETVSLAIWITGILISLYWGISATVYVSVIEKHSEFCLADDPMNMFGITYSVLFVGLPLLVKFVLYTSIFYALYKYASQVELPTLQSARKTVICLVSIDASLLLHSVVLIVSHFSSYTKNTMYLHIVCGSVYILMSSACPIVYGIMDTEVRCAFFSQLTCGKYRRHTEQSEELETIVAAEVSSDQDTNDS